MSQLSAVLRDATDGMLLFWCPGCDGAHGIKVGEGAGPRWGWNGNADKPTFTPSILCRYPKMTAEAEARLERGERLAEGEERWPHTDEVCHSFVNDGRIQFLGDCTHALAGQTVDLPPWDRASDGL